MLNKNAILDATETITVKSTTGADFPDKKATFISGQKLPLIITISGNFPFKSSDIISVTSEDNWMEIKGAPATSPGPTPNSAICTINVTISSDIKFIGKTKKLTIQTTNTKYTSQDFHYLISDLDSTSLSLDLDHFYIEVPTQPNEPSTNNPNRILVSTIAKSKTGEKPIPNLPLSVTVGDQSSLSKVKMTTFDGQPIHLETDSFSKNQYFNLATDSSGNLQFYIYPQPKESTLLKLQCQSISGVLQPPKEPLFILDSENAQFRAHPAPPEILQLHGDVLSPIKDETSFSIKIPEYPNPSPMDYILFILNNNILIYTPVSVDNLGTYYYQLPYSLLQMSDTENTFGYILAIGDLNILYSNTISFKYEWGSKGPSNKQRNLYVPTIYSSYGIDPKNILPPNYIIDFTTLSQYQYNTGAALFVEIQADSTNPNKVHPGNSVTVEVYVESSNRGPQYYTYPLTLPPAIGSKTTSKGSVKIPYDAVGNLGADSEDGGSTILYIDYYTGTNKKTGTFSKKWQAFIDSRMSGG